MNAYEILGVSPNASEEEIRAAWLGKVKEFPPDRSPAEFEKIRDAYDTLRDPRERAKTKLLSTSFAAPLVSLIDNQKTRRVFVGPEPWCEVLKTK
ncbi:MAG TPA: J domain-containing protein [Bryobacteraceae bacterium]|jgi:DnaJ-domain-containing protein 1|nr:J domain-containing protein [Bryobacteraceae bacterium]